MPKKFGKAGTITERTRIDAVTVDFDKGESLHFKVTVSGPMASFAFSCNDGPILVSTKTNFPGHPQKVYEWDKKAADVHSDDDTHTLLMNFISNLKYTYNVEHIKTDNSKIVIKDLDFESKDPIDNFAEFLAIFKA